MNKKFFTRLKRAYRAARCVIFPVLPDNLPEVECTTINGMNTKVLIDDEEVPWCQGISYKLSGVADVELAIIQITNMDSVRFYPMQCFKNIKVLSDVGWKLEFRDLVVKSVKGGISVDDILTEELVTMTGYLVWPCRDKNE